MKIYIKKAITFVAIALFTTTTIAQVKTKVFPENLPKDYLTRRNINKIVEFEAPPIFNQKKAANKNILAINSETDNQFALSKIINYNIINEGDKTTENGMQIYSVTIIAKGALNISLVFSFFELSEGDILSIYTKKEFTDSITSSQNNTNKLWATRVYQGSELNIVLKTSSKKHDMKLILSKINFGYKGFGGDYANVGGSATCHVNANCSAGNGWDNEKNSVAMILVDGIANCTGALVMNTCNTSIPYFLTANHCLGGNLANWVFQFQTLSTDCATNTGWREDIQFNGCVLRANSAGSDFALLQLNQTPSVNSGIYYSGWSNQLNFFRVQLSYIIRKGI